MKLKKKEIDEIVDANGDLIDLDHEPKNGSNLETQANNTTDYNAKVGHQPYRYDMLGRFGFTLLPFFESEENQGPDPLLEDVAAQMFEFYKEILEYYYRNPQKLKNDFRKISKKDYETADNNEEFGWKPAEEILNIIKPHFENALKELDKNLKENINESVIEEKMLNKRDKKDVVKKNDDKEITDKKAKKIADLINKLDKDDVKKIKNLLETD